MDKKTRQKILRMIFNGMFILSSKHGEKYGAATVTWLSQASFDPPLIMIAIRPDSNVFMCLKESKKAVVNILSIDQQDIAKKFFSATKVEGNTLNGEPFSSGGMFNLPILDNVPAWFECTIENIVENNSDHDIVVARVTNGEFRMEAKPLTIEDTPWEYGG